MNFVLAATFAACLLSGCVETKACTAIGCQDQASLRIQGADGAPLRVSASIEIDGRKIECSLAEQDAPGVCEAGVRFWLRELQDCREEISGSSRGLHCVGTGRFEQVVEIAGTPRAVQVVLRRDGAVLAQRTFEPKYEGVFPNGRDCDPVCKQWATTWDVP